MYHRKMGRLRESTVVDKAQVVLKKHYAQRAGGSQEHVVTRKESWMRSASSPRGFGIGRADLLLSFREKGKPTPRCVIVEAKSHRTLGALNAAPGCAPMFVLMTTAGIASFAAAMHFASSLGGFRYLIAIGAFFVGFFLVGQLLHTSKALFTMDVVDQVRKYPAHERWIAVPNDMLGNDYRTADLLALSRRHGIGVLVVSRGDNDEDAIRLLPEEKEGATDVVAQYRCSGDVHKLLPKA
jgi:hypothetical protein